MTTKRFKWSISKKDKEAWKDEFEKYDTNKIGKLNGQVVADILRKSGLPDDDLMIIWTMSDLDNDSFLNANEYCLAKFLVLARLAKQPIPNSLPESLLSSVMENSTQSNGSSANTVDDNLNNFVMTSDKFEQYRATFNGCQENGFIPGSQAVAILSQSGLDQQTLADIWKLADADMDGALNVVEFAVAMHLIHQKIAGVDVPPTLPQSLIKSLQSYSSENTPIPVKNPISSQEDNNPKITSQKLTNYSLENDPFIKAILSLPDTLEGEAPGIDTMYDLSLFQMDSSLKNTGIPSIVLKSSEMNFQPYPHDDLVERYNVIKKVVSEYDPTVDIDNVLTKISNVPTATKVLQSSEPQIIQIKTKLEHEFNLTQQLNAIHKKTLMENNELEKEKENYINTLKEMHAKITSIEEEIKLANIEFSKESAWLNTAPTTYMALANATSPILLQNQAQQIKNEIEEVKKNRATIAKNVELIKQDIEKTNLEIVEMLHSPDKKKQKDPQEGTKPTRADTKTPKRRDEKKDDKKADSEVKKKGRSYSIAKKGDEKQKIKEVKEEKKEVKEIPKKKREEEIKKEVKEDPKKKKEVKEDPRKKREEEIKKEDPKMKKDTKEDSKKKKK